MWSQALLPFPLPSRSHYHLVEKWKEQAVDALLPVLIPFLFYDQERYKRRKGTIGKRKSMTDLCLRVRDWQRLTFPFPFVHGQPSIGFLWTFLLFLSYFSSSWIPTIKGSQTMFWESRIFSITCLIGVDWRKWRTRIGHSNGLEIPNLSRHDYKEKIRRFWIQDSGVLKRKRP